MKLSGIVVFATGIAMLVVLPSSLVAQGPWQQITVPTVREAAASFAKPPREYGAIHWALGFPPAQSGSARTSRRSTPTAAAVT